MPPVDDMLPNDGPRVIGTEFNDETPAAGAGLDNETLAIRTELDDETPAIGAARGRDYWQSLDHWQALAGRLETAADGSPEAQLAGRIDSEGDISSGTDVAGSPAAGEPSTPANSHSRRSFLQIMGASFALAGMTGCRWPRETIMPFAHRPEGRDPGVSQQFATALDFGGAAQGLLVTSYDGRPIKVEGNPAHPNNRGAADAFAQGIILGLYDPDRSKGVARAEGRQRFPSTWDEFADFARDRFGGLRDRRGEGLRVCAETSSSPTLAALRARFLEVYPQAQWHEWEPVSRDNERAGARLAFGRPLRTQLDLASADVIVSLDCDFLFDHPAAIQHTRAFAAGRRAQSGRMNRLHAVESGFSLTGAMADHRYPVAAGAIGIVTGRLAAEVIRLLGSGIPEAAAPLAELAARFGDHPYAVPFAGALARDLTAARGKGIVIAGPRQPTAVHAVAHLLNLALGNTGRTIHYTAEMDPDRPSHPEAILSLTEAMRQGQVDALVILAGNPVYDAPADAGFTAALESVPCVIRLGLYEDETSQACLTGPASERSGAAIRWHIPEAHDLESWGDVRSWDGTWSVVQPLIDPLYDGKTAIELLAALSGDPLQKGYDLVRRTFQERRDAGQAMGSSSGNTATGGVRESKLRAKAHGAPEETPAGHPMDFESSWRTALAEGFVLESAFPFEDAEIQTAPLGAGLASFQPPTPALGRDRLEVVFLPDSKVYDGRFSNNGWLQETPAVLTKLTWDNAAIVGPSTASALGLKADDVVRLRLDGREITLPIYVLPGQAPFSVSLPLGYGRTAAGRVGNQVGANASLLRTARAFHFDSGLTVTPTGFAHKLACTQDHHAINSFIKRTIEERKADLIREATLDEYRRHPDFARERDQHPPLVSLFQERTYVDRKWGMAIDLNSCTGCNACVVACTAENNVPIVGRDRVLKGREMHWIRIDRYFSGDPEAPAVAHQPMACVQCENAPCEQVCPVGATMHDREGLNVQVYNRCIGTRYCLNNCPYKVRRFNFFNYRRNLTPTEEMAYNPDVTVRSRGVMEKCTYCIQRIKRVEIAARNDQRPIRDGEITPACAQTCPAGAIVFGDLNDPESRVSKLQADPRAYAVLGELNTKPRTQYLARLRNPLEGDHAS